MKNKFIKSTIILIFGGAITKILAMIIRIFLTRSIGENGTILYMTILPTFNLTLKRADNISESMEVRLYDVNSNGTYNLIRWKKVDTVILFMHILLLLEVILCAI